VNFERDERESLLLLGLLKLVILGILKKLKDKSGAASVDVL
jgi:hypothetical protein